MHNKDNLNVSITLPLIYRFSGDYGDRNAQGLGYPVSWDLALMVEESFVTIENTPIQNIHQLTYIKNGLIENFTRNLTAAGIAVDYMPLLPKEKYYMYINDFTIEAFLKYYAIAREYINQTGLGPIHRGIIIDTERMHTMISVGIAEIC